MYTTAQGFSYIVISINVCNIQLLLQLVDSC